MVKGEPHDAYYLLNHTIVRWPYVWWEFSENNVYIDVPGRTWGMYLSSLKESSKRHWCRTKLRKELMCIIKKTEQPSISAPRAAWTLELEFPGTLPNFVISYISNRNLFIKINMLVMFPLGPINRVLNCIK